MWTANKYRYASNVFHGADVFIVNCTVVNLSTMDPSGAHVVFPLWAFLILLFMKRTAPYSAPKMPSNSHAPVFRCTTRASVALTYIRILHDLLSLKSITNGPQSLYVSYAL